MALSAILFYTNKVYPKDIVLDKNTIPDDPNERLKDKVFMSVVFTVKHFCEYKDFVVPETTFKDDLKCTKEQMEKILKSLSNKFNVTFDKHWFGTVKDLTIYVKDHKPGKSEESIVAAILGLGLGIGIIGSVLYGAFKLMDWVENLSKKKSSNTNKDETVDWNTVKDEYGKLSEFILKYGKEDPFYAKETHTLITIDEGLQLYNLLKKRYETILSIPKRTSSDTHESYKKKVQDVIKGSSCVPYIKKGIPESKPRTYIQTQYFDHTKVTQLFKLNSEVLELWYKADDYVRACRDKNIDPDDVWDELEIHANTDDQIYLNRTVAHQFLAELPRILKYTKTKLEQAKKQSK